MPDITKPLCVEANASNFATGAVLFQQNNTEVWHSCAYLSQSFAEAEHNYKIYNKKLLAIIHVLTIWQHYLEGFLFSIDI